LLEKKIAVEWHTCDNELLQVKNLTQRATLKVIQKKLIQIKAVSRLILE